MSKEKRPSKKEKKKENKKFPYKKHRILLNLTAEKEREIMDRYDEIRKQQDSTTDTG